MQKDLSVAQESGSTEGKHSLYVAEWGEPTGFRTIDNFLGSRIKGIIDQVFTEVLEYLIETARNLSCSNCTPVQGKFQLQFP